MIIKPLLIFGLCLSVRTAQADVHSSEESNKDVFNPYKMYYSSSSTPKSNDNLGYISNSTESMNSTDEYKWAGNDALNDNTTLIEEDEINTDEEISKLIFGSGLDVQRASKAVKLVTSMKNLIYQMVNGTMSGNLMERVVMQSSKTLTSLNLYLEKIRSTNISFSAPIIGLLAIDNTIGEMQAQTLVLAEKLIADMKIWIKELKNAMYNSKVLLRRRKRTVSKLGGNDLDAYSHQDYSYNHDNGLNYDHALFYDQAFNYDTALANEHLSEHEYATEDEEYSTGIEGASDIGLMDMIGGKLKKPFVKIGKTKMFLTVKIFKTMVVFLKKIKSKFTKIGKWISNLPFISKLGNVYNSFSYRNIHSSLVEYLSTLDFVNVDALQNVDLWNLTIDDVGNIFQVDSIDNDITVYLQDWEDGFTGTLESFVERLIQMDKNFKSIFKKKY